MSQPRGRYPGSRDKGLHQSRPAPKQTSHRQNKPYAKSPPARDAGQTASIFKTRSFKWLVDAVGAENIALGLDSNLSRVAELINGERFTPETAFHIETTLGLPEGFFDQPNPALPSATITRLKAPLDFIHANIEPELTDEQRPSTLTNTHTSNDRLHRESEMPKKIDSGSPKSVVRNSPAQAKSAAAPSAKAASAKAKAPIKRGAQQSLPLNDEAAVQNIRRANLHVLTSRKGSKVRLAAVVDISASNLDNRLYGQKRMDDAEAHRFTERLGLPSAWLDIPREVTDIPESVSALLDPQSGRPAPDQQPRSVATTPETAVARKSASKKVKAASSRHVQPSAVEQSTSAVVTKDAVEALDTASTSAPTPAVKQAADNDASLPVSHLQPAPVPFTAAVAEPSRSATVTSLYDLVGIEPIAEALIKTLAGKARTGRLDEMKALELLRQIVSL
ncbi:hypothetical protein SAMN05443245_5998 [Paraburkholderia fungorum]|uniref:Uncharacterized protein n=1 Tax=Paraburkholderia fungorum TaxID=134537 RepID=A0A1H1JBY3_9BURK|nr:hypothetical protein [Paraburkholderia fungorum]SDR47280.1 hypothetical protein SAMN05443245_5998 [Paraburkholderia fungorum]